MHLSAGKIAVTIGPGSARWHLVAGPPKNNCSRHATPQMRFGIPVCTFQQLIPTVLTPYLPSTPVFLDFGSGRDSKMAEYDMARFRSA